MNYRIFLPVALSVSALVAACGGGGGGGSAIPSVTVSTATFPNILSNYQARVLAGGTESFTISGSCGSGTAVITNGRPTATTFNGQPAFSASRTVAENVTGCSPASRSESATVYYNSAYTQIGQFIPLVRTDVAIAPAPTSLPSSVRVGDKGVYSTMATYQDPSQTYQGTRVLSYEVFADTATTALLALFDQNYDTSNQLQFTQLSRFRVADNGQLTLIDITLRYANGTQLVYTKV
ncbi:MAG: hypothetical protein ABIP94_15555 [Planctomycetota bacterium]